MDIFLSVNFLYSFQYCIALKLQILDVVLSVWLRQGLTEISVDGIYILVHFKTFGIINVSVPLDLKLQIFFLPGNFILHNFVLV
jgi:hypothetical protein